MAAAIISAARVELAPRAQLIWGDIWLAGRYDRGELSERFQFERIVQDFEARRAGRLVYRDRFRWDGPWTTDDAGWYFGGALASASLFIAGSVPDDSSRGRSAATAVALSARFRRELHALVRPSRGRHERPRRHGPAAGRQLDNGPGAPPWLLTSSGLAPNHWFSTPAETLPVGKGFSCTASGTTEARGR